MIRPKIEILSPHVFGYVLGPKLDPNSNIDEGTNGEGRLERYGNTGLTFAGLVSQHYRKNNSQDYSHGSILIDIAREYLKTNFDSISERALTRTRFQQVHQFASLVGDTLPEDREGFVKAIRETGVTFDQARSGLEKAIKERSNVRPHLENLDFVAQAILSNTKKGTKQDDERCSRLFATTLGYLCHRLIKPKEVHPIGATLNMRTVFCSIRGAYDRFHRGDIANEEEVIDPTVSEMYYGAIITRPEILQQRVMLMGKELDLMFPGTKDAAQN